MEINIESVHLGDVVTIKPELFSDDRGWFMEVYHSNLFKDLNLPNTFVQENHSRSIKNVLRGLHFQWDPPMGKIMRVVAGEAFLVAVDIRKGSPTLGQWYGEIISSENKKQIWAPAGFARGFCVLSDYAEIQYKCTGIYNNKCESGIKWNDPEIGIKWPVSNPIISDKDTKAQSLVEWLKTPESDFFTYNGAEVYSVVNK